MNGSFVIHQFLIELFNRCVFACIYGCTCLVISACIPTCNSWPSTQLTFDGRPRLQCEINTVQRTTCQIRTAKCLPRTVLITQVSWLDKVHEEPFQFEETWISCPHWTSDLVTQVPLWQDVLKIKTVITQHIGEIQTLDWCLRRKSSRGCNYNIYFENYQLYLQDVQLIKNYLCSIVRWPSIYCGGNTESTLK